MISGMERHECKDIQVSSRELDPEEVAREIFSKVYELKLEDADVCFGDGWDGLTFSDPSLGTGATAFKIMWIGVPAAGRGLEVARAFKSHFKRFRNPTHFAELSKSDRDFAVIALLGSGAPVGVYENKKSREGVFQPRGEGFCFESLEQALLEFSLRDGIDLRVDHSES